MGIKINKKWMGILIVSGLLLGTFAGLLTGLLKDLPKTKALEEVKPGLTTRVYSSDGQLLARFATENRLWVPLQKMPKVLINAFVSIEDERFFHHWGLDLMAITRAFLKNMEEGQIVQGGSTITQQLVRNLFLTKEKTLRRKLKEALLSLQIERKYTKEEILELYLNHIYLGHGAYGVEAAARAYFGKSAEALTISQCALLASLPKAPNHFSPRLYPERSKARRDLVLKKMYDLGYIPLYQFKKASEEDIELAPLEPYVVMAPYFVEYVRQSLEEKYGTSVLYQGGLKVETTLDVNIQRAAEEALKKGLEELTEKDGKDQPLPLDSPSQEELLQGALVALEPATGHIKAMVGGRDFKESQFNRASQAMRQPGSSIKPFIWTAALESGFTPQDIIVDSPVAFSYGGKYWAPQNYERKFFGPTTLQEALEKSRNVIAVKLLYKLGVNTVIDCAHRMGIESPLEPNLSLALGTSEVTPIEMASAYGTLVNKGIHVKPMAILTIVTAGGRVLEENQPEQEIALSEEVASTMTTLMQGVIERGTGRRAQGLNRPAAGKTGTTDGFNDAWFIGFTPELVACVWIGYDSQQPLGHGMTGGRVAAPIWKEFMLQALDGRPVTPFSLPEKEEL